MMAGFYPIVMSEHDREHADIEGELISVINDLSLEGKQRLLRRAVLLGKNDRKVGTVQKCAG